MDICVCLYTWSIYSIIMMPLDEQHVGVVIQVNIQAQLVDFVLEWKGLFLMSMKFIYSTVTCCEDNVDWSFGLGLCQSSECTWIVSVKIPLCISWFQGCSYESFGNIDVLFFEYLFLQCSTCNG